MSEELKDILADVKQEGQLLDDVLKETATDSPPETKPEVDEPDVGESTHEKEVPFHQHPRWKAREEEARLLRERNEHIEEELNELKTFKEDLYNELGADTGEIPAFFKELYGENEVAWSKYREREREREEEITQRVIEVQKEEAEKAVEEGNYWNDWVGNEIDALAAEGHTFDRNEFIKTMLDYRPTDDNNNFDFQAGMRIYDALHPKDSASSDARKRLADITSRTTSKEGEKRDYMTAADLRNRSWKDL